MKKGLLVLSILFTLFWIANAAGLGLAGWQINQDIDGWKTRAQVSSEPNDMLIYMTNVRSGMESWGMTTGNAALIFKTPATDMELIFKTVTNHVDQAQVLTTMDHSTPEYQTGLDNLRGSVRELDLHSFKYWSVHQGLIFEITAWLSFILACIFWIWFSIHWEYS